MCGPGILVNNTPYETVAAPVFQSRGIPEKGKAWRVLCRWKIFRPNLRHPCFPRAINRETQHQSLDAPAHNPATQQIVRDLHFSVLRSKSEDACKTIVSKFVGNAKDVQLIPSSHGPFPQFLFP